MIPVHRGSVSQVLVCVRGFELIALYRTKCGGSPIKASPSCHPRNVLHGPERSPIVRLFLLLCLVGCIPFLFVLLGVDRMLLLLLLLLVGISPFEWCLLEDTNKQTNNNHTLAIGKQPCRPIAGSECSDASARALKLNHLAGGDAIWPGTHPVGERSQLGVVDIGVNARAR